MRKADLVVAAEHLRAARDILDRVLAGVVDARTDAGDPVQGERIDLREYLKGKGWNGWRLQSILPEFIREVAFAYVSRTSEYPPVGNDHMAYYSGPVDQTMISGVYMREIWKIERKVFGYVLDSPNGGERVSDE